MNKSEPSSIKDKVFTTKNFKLFCFLLLGILMIVLAVLDSMRILFHLYVFAMITAILVLLNEAAIKSINKWALRRKTVLLDTRWKAYLALGSMFYLLSVVSLDQYSTTLFSVLWLSSLVPLLCLPFTGVYPGTVSAVLVLVTVVATCLSILNVTIGILLALILAIFTFWQIKKGLSQSQQLELMKREEEVELERMPRWKRSLLSVTYLVFTGLSIAIIVYWIMLSMNYFWAFESEVSKYGPLHRFPKPVSLHVRRVASVADLEPFRHTPWSMPLVIKPNVCTTSSTNVQLCQDYACLSHYITELQELAGPQKASQLSWVIQDYCAAQEAVVFYYRYPYWRRGSIKNIGIRKQATHTARTADIKGDALQAKYFPVLYYEGSAAMTAFFDSLANRIPGFSGGRFDIMLEDGLEAAQKGEGIRVLETNIFPLGCIDEKANGDTWWSAIRQSVRRYRTALLQMWFGAYNILSGRQRFFPVLLAKVPRLFRRYQLCDHNHENLWAVP